MSDHLIAGHCMKCDTPCWEVKQVWTAGERYPGEPKRLGRLVVDAVRVSYMLLDGRRIDVTLCPDCELAPEDYSPLWLKIIRSWYREMNVLKPGQPKPDWFWEEFNNGILCEMGRVKWKDLNGRTT